LKDELTDQLRKLGLRVRPRTPEKSQQQKPGHVAFDDRGNATYEWNDGTLAQDGDAGERAREKALEYHGLSLVEDEPAKDAPIQSNPKGLRLGYNPYESGVLPQKAWKKKPNLHELSQWVEAKRKAQKKTDD
jgi:hypothetical protein